MRKTCHGCKHLKSTEIMRAPVQYCGKTELVVPHQFDENEITYWRVPLACPLPDDQVLKSEKKAPRKDWVTIPASEA